MAGGLSLNGKPITEYLPAMMTSVALCDLETVGNQIPEMLIG